MTGVYDYHVVFGYMPFSLGFTFHVLLYASAVLMFGMQAVLRVIHALIDVITHTTITRCSPTVTAGNRRSSSSRRAW
jgi:hypothetical protein